MTFKYNDRMCFERYTSKNGAWKLEELLEDKNIQSVIKKFGLKKTKKDICEKLEEIMKEKKGKKEVIKESPPKEKKGKKEVIKESPPEIKNKLLQKCKIYSECPRGYTRKNLVELATECGVSIKDGKKSANMKMICENMKEKYGFKGDDEIKGKKIRLCKNKDTAISMIDVDDIDEDKYIRLSNGYCYDIDELVQTMIMSKDRNINPSDPSNLTPIWKDENEKESIVNHKGLDKSIRQSYMLMIDVETKNDGKILQEISSDSSEILNKIAETGFHCLNDNITSWDVDKPELFQKAQKMLINLRESIRKSKLKVFYERMHVGMIELGTTLDNAHLECIHGIGLKLLTIYCTFYYRISRIKSLLVSPFVYPITKGGKEFIVAGMDTVSKIIYLKLITVYSSSFKHIGKILYDKQSKEYVVVDDTDITPDWRKYINTNKTNLVRFFGTEKKVISPVKGTKIVPIPLKVVKMSTKPKKIVEIEFEDSDEEVEEKSSVEYNMIKSIVNEMESEESEANLIDLKHKLNSYIYNIDFYTLTRDKKIDQEFKKLFSSEKISRYGLLLGYENMILRSKEQNKRKLDEEEFNNVKNTSFKSLPDIYIKVVLSQVHSDSGITSDGISKLKDLLNPLISKFDLGEYPPKDDRVDIVKKNIEKIIHGALGKHARSETQKVLVREESKYIRHAVVEYLLAELLELSGNVARGTGRIPARKKITSSFISKAIEGDEELNSLFNSMGEYKDDESKEDSEDESSSSVCDFYDSIDNDYKVFSNYGDNPVKIDDIVWPSPEHYYHSQKFSPSDDEDIAWYQEKIRSVSTPNKSKMLGNQKVTGRFGTGTFLNPSDKTLLKDIIDESKARGISMRKDWEKVKDSVMYKVVKAKLEQHPQVKKILLSTGKCIIREASPTDYYWGIGKDNSGKNMLGITYMKLRDEYMGVKRTIEDYKKMVESVRDIKNPITPSDESKPKSKKKSSSERAFDVVSKLDGIPKDLTKTREFYHELGKKSLVLLENEDINKYTISELKYLIHFFNNGVFGKEEKYTYVGKKKADFVNDLKYQIKKRENLKGEEEDEIDNEEEENTIKTVDGDLLSYVKTHYIVHQCNAVTDQAKGIAETIFKKFPDADIYSDGTKRKLGDVFIRGKIINLVGQHYPGPASRKNDTIEKRVDAFKKGLETISKKIPSNSSIAFPYNIGCGLAKGDWKVYKKMIQDFANNNKDLKILLVKK